MKKLTPAEDGIKALKEEMAIDKAKKDIVKSLEEITASLGDVEFDGGDIDVVMSKALNEFWHKNDGGLCEMPGWTLLALKYALEQFELNEAHYDAKREE